MTLEELKNKIETALPGINVKTLTADNHFILKPRLFSAHYQIFSQEELDNMTENQISDIVEHIQLYYTKEFEKLLTIKGKA